MKVKEILYALEKNIELYGSGPTYEEMKYRTLEDKGIAGSTAAHIIEEVHTPNNYAYITFTTGTSAFQNLVGVVRRELDMRLEVGKNILEQICLQKGDKLLVTYPPLINVFYEQVFRDYGVKVIFLKRPSRDALLLAMCKEKPKAVIGESKFLRCGIEDGKRLGIISEFPAQPILIAAGAPLDLELLSVCEALDRPTVHDLYGCQEFGWLMLNGIPLRQDITLIPCGNKLQYVHVTVGGLSTGDTFSIGPHIIDRKGLVATYASYRSTKEWKTRIIKSTALDVGTVYRLAKSIMRMKGKVVEVDNMLRCNAKENAVNVINPDDGTVTLITGNKLRLLEDLLYAQLKYQARSKMDPVWCKKAVYHEKT